MPEAAPLLLLHADVQPKETLHMDLLWSWRQAAVPVLQLMISRAARAKDAAEIRSSSPMGEGCEGKGREEGTIEGKSKDMIMRQEDDPRGIKCSFWGALQKPINWWLFLH